MKIEKANILVDENSKGYMTNVLFIDCDVDIRIPSPMFIRCAWEGCHFNTTMEKFLNSTVSNYTEGCTFAEGQSNG